MRPALTPRSGISPRSDLTRAKHGSHPPDRADLVEKRTVGNKNRPQKLRRMEKNLCYKKTKQIPKRAATWQKPGKPSPMNLPLKRPYHSPANLSRPPARLTQRRLSRRSTRRGCISRRKTIIKTISGFWGRFLCPVLRIA